MVELICANWASALRVATASLLLLVLPLSLQPSPALSFSIDGMTVQTKGTHLWTWTTNRVLLQLHGTDQMAEVKTLDGTSVSNVRAIVEAAGSMWILNSGHVYRHAAGTLKVEEVLTPKRLTCR